MAQFNQELITKARKGEIAILNDGTKEDLYELIKTISTIPNWSYQDNSKWLYLSASDNNWRGLKICNMPFHSAKDFFMDTNPTDQPRTYRVTRQQMKEIWDCLPSGSEKHTNFLAIMGKFTLFGDQHFLHEGDLQEIITMFPILPDLIRSIFPSYFFIPEGEPVLVRDLDNEEWKVFVSDGEGCVYFGNELGGSSIKFNQIIPFTKNPPK